MKHDIGCSVNKVSYDNLNKIGYLHMAPGNCCDMGSCIDLFVEIDDQIQTIITYEGGNPDTRYERHDKDWIAL